MIDHFGIICADYTKSKEYYDAVLGVLGHSRQMDVGPAIGYGRNGKPDFWIEDGSDREVGAPIHFAFQATSTDEVKAFYDAAVKWGPSRCTSRGCGRNTTPATSVRSSATPTATTSRPYSTAPSRKAKSG